MVPAFSVYLDLVRFLAALVVVMSHVWPMLFPNHPLPWPGHDAVVVFFVLSGLVIAYSADRQARTLSVYIQHRVVRIASVAVPALLLSAIIAPHIPATVNIYEAAAVTGARDFWMRIVLNFFFLAQSWSLDLSPPIDSPFWSLNFEVWYYALFGIWHYTSGHRRSAMTVIAALIAGPKILLLMPIWLLGVVLYRHCPRLSERTALLLLGASVAMGLGFFWLNLSVVIRVQMMAWWPSFVEPLHGANEFVGDTLLGLIVATNFIAIANLSRFLQPLVARRREVKLLASFTFSIYLYHMPLFALLYGVMGLRTAGIVLPLLAAAIIAAGLLTEKQAPSFRDWLARRPLYTGAGAERSAGQA